MRAKKIKLPKAPKASASIESKERYLKKVQEVKKRNAQQEADKRKSEALSKKIAAVRGCK